MLKGSRRKGRGVPKRPPARRSGRSWSVIREDCPLESFHGEVFLDKIKEVDPGHLVYAGKDRSLSAFAPRKTVFLDLETTGLSGGAGTLAFLVGLVHLDGDNLTLHQYLLEDPDAEAEMLEDVHGLLKRFTGLVTYNGKTFDLPLLETRFIIQGITEPLPLEYHLDLLHTARRFWREELPSCQLKEVEKGLLGIERVGDVGGWEIPEIYFRFLRSGRENLLKPILTHNAVDIKSLVALTVKAAETVSGNLDGETARPAEKFILGRIMEEMEDHDLAVIHLEEAAGGLSGDVRYQAMRSLSLIHKRRLCWNEAGGVWEVMIRECPLGPFPWIELAKRHEHRVKDLERALMIVEEAMERLSTVGPADTLYASASLGLLDLDHRLKRLRRKIESHERD